MKKTGLTTGPETRSRQLPTRGKDTYSIQSVENALNVLEALCEEENEVRISRLSEKLDMNKTSVFRLLATLENRGYVEREKDSGKYKLGLSAYEMGQKFLSKMDLLKMARPVMGKLVRECNEAVYIAVRSGEEVLFLDSVDTPQQVKIVTLVGKRYPFMSTSAGRVLAGHAEINENWQQETDTDCGALGEGIASIAVPLMDGSGKKPGSLCMIGPEFRLTPEKVSKELLPSLAEAGMVISSKLGFVGHFINKEIYR